MTGTHDEPSPARGDGVTTDRVAGTAGVSAASVRAFRCDGVTVLRGPFADWVAPLRAGVEKNLAQPGPWVRHLTPDGNPGRFFGDYCNWQRIPEYREFVERSPLGEIAAALTGAREVRFFHEHVLVKEPGTLERTPWHHDQPYYSLDCEKCCSLWIPLDRIARETCPEFVVGSHRWGRWFAPTRFSGERLDRDGADEGLEPVPDIDAHRGEYDIVSWALAPGDAIAFHFLTVHGAPANRTASRRRGFSARVVGEDARWAARSGPTSPPFPELHARLAHGDPIEGLPEFPVIWRKAA